MNYATDLIRTGGDAAQHSSGKLQRSLIYLTVVAVLMIAVAGGALAALAG
ncbi:MAG: hypothetical protein L6R19_18595 [Alphaproteobacteria bacterium]|nr:hypothetical protein [Alphaproteobacteria bacterium]